MMAITCARNGESRRIRLRAAGHSPEPCLFPENQATGLAAPVPSSVASNILEVNRPFHAPPLHPVRRVARFVRSFEDTEALPAIRKHLGHEGQPIELRLAVECGEDFLFASDFDEFPRPQVK